VYCDFHFSTSSVYRQDVVDAICRELHVRKEYLGPAIIETLYFGGGTPSQLTIGQLNQILTVVFKEYRFSEKPEITLEANPDDLSNAYLSDLKSLGFNRLSIGVQSFHEQDLKFMNRAHSSQQALQCIDQASASGFENLSIDLIYGTPGLTDELWISNLERAALLPINHLSSYSLTVESGTPLAKKIRTGKATGTDEDQSANQFELLQEYSSSLGFEHYEISNLARDGAFARHNSSYWKNVPYLGIGPSAHSFDGNSRRINLPNNSNYHRSAKDVPHDLETLTPNNRFNELVLIGLRTKWGIQKDRIIEIGESYIFQLQSAIQPYILANEIAETSDAYVLNPKAWLRADGIAASLFC
jgi:oxygen-independent coproporphyrinogen-3 oxidase